MQLSSPSSWPEGWEIYALFQHKKAWGMLRDEIKLSEMKREKHFSDPKRLVQ